MSICRYSTCEFKRECISRKRGLSQLSMARTSAPRRSISKLPAVPGSDVEHALPTELLRNRKLRNAALQTGEIAYSLKQGAVGQFGTMPPAMLGAAIFPVPDVVERIGQSAGIVMRITSRTQPRPIFSTESFHPLLP